ncbi:MAG: translation initiation factor IF-3 [Coriobacteriia bacterium]|nr:translation initiation factor IF-3 [Coriobacteriia bacterium]
MRVCSDGTNDGSRKRCVIANEHRVNEDIYASKCRLIGSNGEQFGVYSVDAALDMADDAGLDLVEIAPHADPPVCKIMDYGKFKYELSQKAKAAKKNQQRVEIKEMKFRPKVDVGDYNTKKRHILRFLDAGAKVKVTIMFRGREMAYPELGLRVLERLADDLEGIAVIENQPKLEGRNMHMLITPVKERSSKERPKAKEASEKASKEASEE